MVKYDQEKQVKIRKLTDKIINNCSNCSGREFTLVDGEKKKCNCRLELWKYGYAVLARIPERFWYNRISDYPGFESENNKYKIIREWVLNYLNDIKKHYEEGKGIAFFGGYKVGKTSLLCQVLWNYLLFLETADDSFYCTSREIDAVWHYEKDYDSGFDRRDIYKSSGIIFIDDIGNEYHYGYKDQIEKNSKEFSLILHEIIKKRNDNRLVTLLTTKMSIKKFSQKYGKDIIDSIRDSMFVKEFSNDLSLIKEEVI